VGWLNETRLTQLVSLGRSCREHYLAYHNENTYSRRFLQRLQHVNAAPQASAETLRVYLISPPLPSNHRYGKPNLKH
jgi:hypothetical protein